MTERKSLVALDENQKAVILSLLAGKQVTEAQAKSAHDALRDAYQYPPVNLNTSVDPDLPDRTVFAALSIVPSVGLDSQDAELNNQRLAMAVALQEALHHFLDPLASIGGVNLRELLQDADMRRKMRVGSEGPRAGVGLKVEAIIDSVLVADYLAGKRPDLLTLYIVDDVKGEKKEI